MRQVVEGKAWQSFMRSIVAAVVSIVVKDGTRIKMLILKKTFTKRSAAPHLVEKGDYYG
jgi:hypothetical protein